MKKRLRQRRKAKHQVIATEPFSQQERLENILSRKKKRGGRLPERTWLSWWW